MYDSRFVMLTDTLLMLSPKPFGCVTDITFSSRSPLGKADVANGWAFVYWSKRFSVIHSKQNPTFVKKFVGNSLSKPSYLFLGCHKICTVDLSEAASWIGLVETYLQLDWLPLWHLQSSDVRPSAGEFIEFVCAVLKELLPQLGVPHHQNTVQLLVDLFDCR